MAFAPFDRFDWLLENLLVFLFVGIGLTTYRAFKLSDLSYALIILFLAFHAYGAHYTYAETPFGFWLGDRFDLERNHYDRIVHFLFGLLIFYPAREAVMRGLGIVGFWGYCLGFLIANSFSHIYEIVEWLAAEILDPGEALAFLGSQGDVFDAQKDIVLAMIGALIGWFLTVTAKTIVRRRSVLRETDGGR